MIPVSGSHKRAGTVEFGRARNHSECIQMLLSIESCLFDKDPYNLGLL